MPRASKMRASKLVYQSINQLSLEGFETPFSQKLQLTNRWVLLSSQIPWDEIVSVYNNQMRNGTTGASHINGRVVLGSLMIKHMCNLSDEETILQIQENMYMQYFIGYTSYSNEVPFDSSLFVEIRKRLGKELINEINEKIVEIAEQKMAESKRKDPPEQTDINNESRTLEEPESKTHGGRLLLDATACPQDIAYPTDLNILNNVREKSEELIDLLYNKEIHSIKKPRTYREKARRLYLKTAQKKTKTSKEIYSAIGKQLRFSKRNIKHINNLLDQYDTIPFDKNQYKYWLVIQESYRQQQEMFDKRTHSIEHRIVSIHQPHVRPIVRGKANAKVEFGSKLHLSLVNGFAFLDELSWDAYNEGTLLLASVEQYKRRKGFFPEEVLADKIYCSRVNRQKLKELGIRLIAKPLGRPSAVNREHIKPGERNPIEGKFGQGKNAYGLGRIRARLSNTSQSWIASIILVLNLVKLAGQALIALFITLVSMMLNVKNHNRNELLIQ